jgi:NitT/TauT family transport system permease protein/sulfonate transport system permease protein
MTSSTLDPAGRKARLAGHLFVLAFLAIWILYSSLVESYVMPGPWLVFARLGLMFTDVHEIGHMFYSFAHIIASVAISFVIGTALAFLAHYLGTFERMVHGRLSPFLNSFSGIGWTFLAIIWFGISDVTVIFVISMVLIPFAIINMREALANLDQERIEMSVSFTRSGWRRFRLVILPSLYPFMFATIRISFGVAWKVALTAELFGGNTGLGYMLNLARQDFDMPLVIAVIVIIIAFVYSTDRWIFMPIQAHLARHHGSV